MILKSPASAGEMSLKSPASAGETKQPMPITTTSTFSPPGGGEYVFSGDHIWKVTPVPIPNTVVKLPEPMVVPQARE